MKKTIIAPDWAIKMIEEFQCPGCVGGGSVDCDSFVFESDGNYCEAHVLGTLIGGVGNFALGLPKGFCRPGFNVDRKPKNKIALRFWKAGTMPDWDDLNIPVWALEKNGFLFVRTYMPRINIGITDVIEQGKMGIIPPSHVVNVEHIYEEID